eukprot:m.102469 g.102469  ORF g.102469 m.102469 type:complete len:181 (+) comp13775_c0_seq5:2153-2695(+)
MATSPQISSLRQVLVAYSRHNPAVGYCQGLNMVAALGLLYLDEEETFWFLVAIVEYILPEDYYSSDMVGSQTDQRVLRDVIAERCPKLYTHLEKNDIDFGLVTFSWMLTIFIDSLPPPTVVRVFDVFLFEGSKIIFRIAIGMFLMYQNEILKVVCLVLLYDCLETIIFGRLRKDRNCMNS